MSNQVFEVPSDVQSLRLDLFLAERLQISRSSVQRLIDDGFVTVNGQIRLKRFCVQNGDIVSVLPQEPPPVYVSPEPMTFDILYEDEDLFIINKPPNMVVHPAPGNRSGTFVNGFVAYCQDLQCDDPLRPGIVHRLDKDTSGVLVAVKKPEILASLSQQFQDRLVEKEYLAIVVGRMTEPRMVNGPIGRDPNHRQRMAIVSSGKEAKTEFFPCRPPFRISRQCAFDCTLVTAKPKTGRTHQIRVHAASLLLPILGDQVYGGSRSSIECRQMLHCRKMEFVHPRTGCAIVIEAPIPLDMKRLLPETLG